MKKTFLIYQRNQRTGSLTLLGQEVAANKRQALAEFGRGRTVRSGVHYIVIPWKVITAHVILAYKPSKKR